MSLKPARNGPGNVKRMRPISIQYSDMVTSAHAPVQPDDAPDFQYYWLAETVRLRESQWGPLQDSKEARQARTQGRDFTQRLLLRARYLGQREGMDIAIRQWARGAKLAFFVLLALAILTGAATALGALGDGTRHVNLIMALTAMLGLHVLTFIFWAISSLFPSGSAHTGLGELWLWLTRKLARGPQAALIPRALLGMLSRHRALRPLLGAISHAVWSCALVAMLITLVALLSARRYTFSWETTLLSSDTFVMITKGLGWLPSKLGFGIPPDAVIHASDGLQTLPASAHTLWSGWLIGCVLCYGLLPRLVALTATVISTTRRIKNISLDAQLPGYIELRDRLEPLSAPGGIDSPAPTEPAAPPGTPHFVDTGSRHAIVGLELADDVTWPPAPLAPHVADLGVVDDRLQRQRLLDHMQTSPPSQLLIVCDGNQTPDRGVIALILELGSLAHQMHVLLLTATASGSVDLPFSQPERLDSWKQYVQHAGLPTHAIYVDTAGALDWLNAPSGHASGSTS